MFKAWTPSYVNTSEPTDKIVIQFVRYSSLVEATIEGCVVVVSPYTHYVYSNYMRVHTYKRRTLVLYTKAYNALLGRRQWTYIVDDILCMTKGSIGSIL